jgi:hypothetical protein
MKEEKLYRVWTQDFPDKLRVHTGFCSYAECEQYIRIRWKDKSHFCLISSVESQEELERRINIQNEAYRYVLKPKHQPFEIELKDFAEILLSFKVQHHSLQHIYFEFPEAELILQQVTRGNKDKWKSGEVIELNEDLEMSVGFILAKIQNELELAIKLYDEFIDEYKVEDELDMQDFTDKLNQNNPISIFDRIYKIGDILFAVDRNYFKQLWEEEIAEQKEIIKAKLQDCYSPLYKSYFEEREFVTNLLAMVNKYLYEEPPKYNYNTNSLE